MNCKRWTAIALLVILLCSCVSGFGEFSARDHNKWTEEIIFGNNSYKSYKPRSIVQAVECLEDAILLCIDQFGNNYGDKLDRLNVLNIKGIPSDLSSIDLKASGKTHRSFTHRGWYHSYDKDEIGQGHADVRKQLLYSVVDYVFDFKKHCSTTERAEKVCDAMCCLLYVTHIIADRYHSDVYNGAGSTLLLAENTESVIHDLLECLPVLFLDQKKDSNADYNQLIIKLQNLSATIIRESRRAETSEDAKNELLSIDKKYAEELKEILARYIPELLYKQNWFVEVFPLEWRDKAELR